MGIEEPGGFSVMATPWNESSMGEHDIGDRHELTLSCSFLTAVEGSNSQTADWM